MTLENLLFYGLVGIPSGLLMIGVLIVFHEFGHFIVARMFGIGTPVFSVGIGTRLWGFEWRGTDFRISALPLGGYVQLAGVDPFGEEDAEAMLGPADPEHFLNHPVHERFLVMSAGPAANLLLAVMIFMAALMVGREGRDNSVGTVIPGTVAAELGIERGDRVVAIDGQEVRAWRDWERLARKATSDAVDLTLERDGEVVQLQLPGSGIPLAFDGTLDSEKLGMLHTETAARVGIDDPDSPAAVAGLQTGDLILAVDDETVLNWHELVTALGDSGTHELEVLRGFGDEASRHTMSLSPAAWSAPNDDLLAVGTWGFVPVEVFISSVSEGSPAQAAGLLAGDRMYAVDGKPIRSWAEITWLVGATMSADGQPRPLKLDVVRGGQRISHDFAPEVQRFLVRGEPHHRPIMGVMSQSGFRVVGGIDIVRYGPIEAIPPALDLTVETIRKIFRVLGHLVVYEVEFKEAMGGPVAIVQMAAQSASLGIWVYVQTLAMISISLGIMNLLPVPVLDGGHILFYFVEMVRGRPLPLVFRERVQMVGGLFIAALMVIAFVNDIGRLFDGAPGP